MKAATDDKEPLVDRVAQVGEDLGRTLTAVLRALPGAPRRPNQLARDLGLNRDIASRVLGATAKTDPLSVVHRIPGPEPLRRFVRAAEKKGAPAALAGAAREAIDAFDALIRDDAGTRAALDAMISAGSQDARERFETASKYSVYKGMSQLKGVLAKHWLGTAVVVPSASDETRLDLTWLTGAVAMQRLRPGVTVRFGYRDRALTKGGEIAPEGPGDELKGLPGIETLERFCVNPPAPLEARAAGRAVHYTLPDELLGPRDVCDVYVVDDHPSAMRRYSEETPPRRVSLFVEPALPVASLVFDVLLHDDAFPGAEPTLFVYDTGYDGIANVNDSARDIDRVDLKETVEVLGRDLRSFEASEIAHYNPMLLHLAERSGWDPARFRGYRTRIQYPVYGWQVCLAFTPPKGPGA